MKSEGTMRFKTKVFISSIMAILSIYIVFFTCIDTIAFNRHFFNFEYGYANTAENLKMSKTSLYVASDTLLDYLQDYRDNIDVKVVVDGKEREVFNAREKAHMVDVKNLYQDAKLIRNVMVGVFILLLLFLCVDKKKETKEAFTYAYIRVAIIFTFMLSAIVLFALSDFTAFWTFFHQLFFTNDLWLLNPATSIMINMFPEIFFNHMVMAIAISFSTIFIGFLIYSIRYQKKLIRKLEATN